MKEETQIAVKAAKAAGRILLGHFGTILDVERKGPKELVTQVDLECNRKIISTLRAAYPEHGIYSEETPEDFGDSECRWVIDPVDGTHNFIYGMPLFGVSIALEREGKSILGVMYLPYNNRLLVAEKGRGATLNSRRIHVTVRKSLKNAMIIFGGDVRNPSKRQTAEAARKVEEGVFGIRRFGSAVAHYDYVASGAADAYIQIRNKVWDNAAGFLIVEEAGGKVTDWSGRDWNINTTQFVASNGRIHKELLRLVGEK